MRKSCSQQQEKARRREGAQCWRLLEARLSLVFTCSRRQVSLKAVEQYVIQKKNKQTKRWQRRGSHLRVEHHCHLPQEALWTFKGCPCQNLYLMFSSGLKAGGYENPVWSFRSSTVWGPITEGGPVSFAPTHVAFVSLFYHSYYPFKASTRLLWENFQALRSCLLLHFENLTLMCWI